MPAARFFLPLWQDSYSCLPSLDLATHQAGYWRPPFCFPKGRTKSQVCGVSLGCIWLAFWASSLAIWQSSLSLPSGTHREPALGWGFVWGGGTWSTECVHGPGVWICVRGVPSGSCLGYLMESRILAPLMPSEVLSAALPRSSRPPVVQLMTQLLLMEWEKWASLAASCVVGEVEPSLTHSRDLIFPRGRNHGPRRSLLTLSCATLGEW